MTGNILASKAMLAGVRIKKWSVTKLDRNVTDQVHRQHNAAADSGRYSKALIAKSALQAIDKAANEARIYHYKVTLPWQDNGNRLLPSCLYTEYSDAMRLAREAFERESAAFVANYPSFVADAKIRLNGLFESSDYPDAAIVAKRFSFDVNISPVPDAADFRVNLGASELQRVQDGVRQQTQEALQEAMRDVWKRVAENVGHMAERLKAFKPATGTKKAEGIFRDSLVENVRELVGLLPSLNITGDPALSDIATAMQSELCALDPAELRDSDAARAKIAKAADAISARVSDYL